MILIADSGSTKTDWRLIDDNKQIHQHQTIGLNPYFIDTASIVQVLTTSLISNPVFNVSNLQPEIHFYGAGCRNEEKNNIIRAGISAVFPKASIEVNNDLLGAARALCGHQKGIAAILGTGSNTCYYDGKTIVYKMPSLGFILGDEGSGAHIGKTFIKAYLNMEVPENIAIRFEARTKTTKDDILNAVYKDAMPSKYLASFTKFILQNIQEQFMVDLVSNCFRQFFTKHINKYPEHKYVKMSCVGSVGFYFSNLLRAVADEHGVLIDKIIETPIAALTHYHLNE